MDLARGGALHPQAVGGELRREPTPGGRRGVVRAARGQPRRLRVLAHHRQVLEEDALSSRLQRQVKPHDVIRSR